MYVDIYWHAMSMYHVYAWYPWKSEDSIRCSGVGVTDGCEPPRQCWGLNPGPLENQPELFFVCLLVLVFETGFLCIALEAVLNLAL